MAVPLSSSPSAAQIPPNLTASRVLCARKAEPRPMHQPECIAAPARYRSHRDRRHLIQQWQAKFFLSFDAAAADKTSRLKNRPNAGFERLVEMRTYAAAANRTHRSAKGLHWLKNRCVEAAFCRASSKVSDVQLDSCATHTTWCKRPS